MCGWILLRLVLLLLLLYHSFAVVPSASSYADPNQIKYSYVSNEMDGWKDGWVDEGIYGSINGTMDGWIDGLIIVDNIFISEIISERTALFSFT